MNTNFFCVDVWICKTLLYICYVNNDKQTHNDMNNCPVYTAVNAKSTEMIFSCMAIFEKKGSMSLTQDEFFVEGTMLQVLSERGFDEWTTAYVERM